MNELHKQIIELRKQDKSYNEISRAVGLTKDGVAWVCRKYGVAGQIRMAEHTEEEYRNRNLKIIELMKEGKEVKELAKEFELSESTICSICSEELKEQRRIKKEKRILEEQQKQTDRAEKERTSKEIEDRIERLIKAGKTTKEVAEVIGDKSTSRVRRVMKERNLHVTKQITDKQKQIIELSNEGHTVTEIAKELGYKSNAYVIKVRKQFNIESPSAYKDIEEVKQFISERIPDFEYVGGYTGCDDDVTIRCKKCGTVTTRNMGTIRHSNVRCEVCAEREREERKRIKTELKEKQRIETRIERARLRKLREQRKKQEHEARRREVVCPVCGKTFVTYNAQKKYCSKECANRVINSHHGRDKRFAKYGIKRDSTINVQTLYEKDNGICWLCGKPCDFNDYEIREDGTKICGNNYPSVDHVIPLAKGGTDTWDNVRLAHRICNSRRGADD